ncbi:MAG: hypothetical protein SFU98_14165 [Leptospiraceae bacterium]|nr:hypothetical protein [Leptospiraceae bacterium]
MKDLLPLTDNFVFKAIFSQNPDLLLDLLNSFPEFQKTKIYWKLERNQCLL